MSRAAQQLGRGMVPAQDARRYAACIYSRIRHDAHLVFAPDQGEPARRTKREESMQTNPSLFRAFWNRTLCASIRTVLGGLGAAAAGGLFCLTWGVALCWAYGTPLGFAGVCGLRGVFAGLVAGMIIGALSGIYHVEEPRRAGAKIEICKDEPASCNPAPAPPLTPSLRNGKTHMHLG
jgi:hypothetical protein